MADAAKHILVEIDKQNKHKYYISNETWNLIEERNACREQGDVEKDKDLNKQIKKSRCRQAKFH